MLIDRLQTGPNIWIGLRQSNGQWEWINDEPLTDNNWSPGEPNGRGNEYAYMWGLSMSGGDRSFTKWNDDIDSGRYNYLLEKTSTVPVPVPNTRITTAKQYSQAPFPSDIVPEDIGLSQTNKPSVGLLRDASITGISIYDRNLSEEEVEKYDTTDEAYVPDMQ